MGKFLKKTYCDQHPSAMKFGWKEKQDSGRSKRVLISPEPAPFLHRLNWLSEVSYSEVRLSQDYVRFLAESVDLKKSWKILFLLHKYE